MHKSQKKQYDKRSHPVTIKAGDTVFVKVQPKFKLDCNYHGPYRVYEATDTNVKVKPVSSPDAESRTISLQQVSNARETFQQINFGVVIILLTLKSKGKFVRNRTLDLEQGDSQRMGNLMWLVKQHYLYTGHDMEEL